MKKGKLWNRFTAAVLCTALALALPAQAVRAENGAQDAKPQNPWDKTADTSWYSDTGTEFEISTPQQLAGLAQLVNAGNTFAGKKIRLENDIFLNDDALLDDDEYDRYEYAWTAIGASKGRESEDAAFEGYFDGGRHTIYNMQTYMNSGGGLFGCIGEHGFVKSVDISQGILYGGACIADKNKGTIAFCSNNSRIEDESISREVGGICNTNYGLVYGCKNYGELWGREIGGIVGWNVSETLATVSQCSNHGTVNGVRTAAGIINRNGSWVTNCYNVGEVKGVHNGINVVLGVAGIVYNNMQYSQITNSYSAGKISEGETNAGQIYSQNSGKVKNCYAVKSEVHGSADDTVSTDESKSPEFVAKLDQQTDSVLSVWRQDTDLQNDGMPITAADVSYASGQCKIQPEAWILKGEKEIQADLEQQTLQFSFDTYYNEAEPVVTIADPQIAQAEKKENGAEKKENRWDIQLKKAGSTKIKVHFEETENNSSADYELTLTVTAKTPPQEVKIEKISLSVADVSLDAGKTLQLQAEIIPENAANKNLKWTSDNEAVATVENGVVHAAGAGTAVITVESQDGSGVRASCVVSVKKESTEGGNQTPGGGTTGGNTPGGGSTGGNTPDGGSTGGNTPGSGTTGGNNTGGSTGGNTPGSGSTGGNTPDGGSTGGNTPGSGSTGGNTPGSGSTGGNTPGGGTTGGNNTGGNTSGGTTGGSSTGGNTSGGSTGGNTSGNGTGGNTSGSGTSGGAAGGNASGSASGSNPAGGTNADGAGSGNNANGGNGNTGGNGQTANKPEETIQVELLYYIVDFNANMGTNLSRKNMTLLNNDALGILPKVQRKNYTFSGWYTQKDGGVKVSSATRLNAGTMLFARWQEVVKPSKVKTTALKSAKKGQVKASFQKVSGSAGYQVQYAANNKFTAAKTLTAGAAAKAKTLTGLTAGKKYYVRVRAYTVDSMGNRIYGAYSAAKSVKVKA